MHTCNVYVTKPFTHILIDRYSLYLKRNHINKKQAEMCLAIDFFQIALSILFTKEKYSSTNKHALQEQKCLFLPHKPLLAHTVNSGHFCIHPRPVGPLVNCWDCYPVSLYRTIHPCNKINKLPTRPTLHPSLKMKYLNEHFTATIYNAEQRQHCIQFLVHYCILHICDVQEMQYNGAVLYSCRCSY